MILSLTWTNVRPQALEVEVRNMRARCARLARVARGEPADPAKVTARNGDTTEARPENREGQHQSQGDEWVEAAVQEAAVAMESGRRRTLEEEIERSGHFQGIRAELRCCFRFFSTFTF